jgi:hypothetical protein
MLSFSAVAQEARLAPNAPKDNPVPIAQRRQAAFEAAIAPYVAQARSTYPGAKARFLSGLPHGQIFFVTTRVRSADGKVEQVFVRVAQIENGMIQGRIASDVTLVPGYRQGDSYAFPESQLLDWLIAHPDGSEEGNVVGKFLDTYHPGGT